MRAQRRGVGFWLLTVAALGTLVVLSGCGSKSKPTPKKPTPVAPSGAPTISLGTPFVGPGPILVGANKKTLYLFTNDNGTTSNCYGNCASVWPPLTTQGTPTVGSGLQPSLIGTTKRTDGTIQVTYNGYPLYYYSGDQSPGDTAGRGITSFGGLWYDLSANGTALIPSG